jgi:hypothetical protein
MLQDSAYGATLCLPTASGGATSHAGTTGSGSRRASSLEPDEVHRLLTNWQRWAATAFPNLGVQPPPWAEQWIPHKAWDSGWGDPVPLDPPSDAIDERLAEWTDKLLMKLPIAHLLTIKRHYINHKRQDKEKLAAAIRAFGDLFA